MADLTLDEVRDIGTAAIRRVIGDTFTGVGVVMDLDAEDRAAYRFSVRFPSEVAWRRASALQAEMNGSIIDDLYLRGHELLPFIRILSDGSWTFRRDVAAE